MKHTCNYYVIYNIPGMKPQAHHDVIKRTQEYYCFAKDCSQSKEFKLNKEFFKIGSTVSHNPDHGDHSTQHRNSKNQIEDIYQTNR